MQFNDPRLYPYTTFDEVFQNEPAGWVGWARDSITIEATKPQLIQIGQILVIDGDVAKVPTSMDDISNAKTGALTIFIGKDLPINLVTQQSWTPEQAYNFDPNVINFTDGNLKAGGVVIGRGSAGGAIGDAEIKLFDGATTAQKMEVFKRLRNENLFKVMKQQVKG